MSKNTNPQNETPEQAQEPPDALAEGGRKALEAEREARRRAEREAREARARAQELELAQLRRRVAEEKGLTEAQAEFLRGDTEEELKAAAEKLLDAFRRDEEPPRRPRERLKPGAVPSSEPKDFGEIADRVRSRL